MASATSTIELPKQERASHTRPGKDVLGRPPGYVVPEKDRIPIVTEWSGMTDYDHAPPSYAVFFEQYYTYTNWYVSKFLPKGSNQLEDIVMELMTRFMERDSVGVFSNSWESRSKKGHSVFRTYYTHFLLAYTPGKRRNAARIAANELLIMNAPVSDDGSVTWADIHAPTSTIDTEVEFNAMVAGIHDSASTLDVDIVDRMIELALGATKKLRRTDVAMEFQVDARTAQQILDTFVQSVGSAVSEGR